MDHSYLGIVIGGDHTTAAERYPGGRPENDFIIVVQGAWAEKGFLLIRGRHFFCVEV